jgi:DNA-binding transcriptional MocR family regulator
MYTAAINDYWVPYGVKFKPCRGGYFFWIELPEIITATEVAKEALEVGVWLMEGTSCMVPGDSSVVYMTSLYEFVLRWRMWIERLRGLNGLEKCLIDLSRDNEDVPCTITLINVDQGG